MERQYVDRIAKETSISPDQVSTIISLLDGGETTPFIAKYRRDKTGNLDEAKLEIVEERIRFFSALFQRRNAVVAAVTDAGRMTPEFRGNLESCIDREGLETLFLPYKERKPSRATAAYERGLEPLADFLLEQTAGDRNIQDLALSLVNPEKGVDSPEQAVAGALHIVSDKVAMDPHARELVRARFWKDGKITSCSTKNAEGKKTKFEAFYDFSESVAAIPSHRHLALLRGVKEGVLRMELRVDDDALETALLQHFLKEAGPPFESLLKVAVGETYRLVLRPVLEQEVLSEARRRAEVEAVRIFRKNAESLLMAPPAGAIKTLGIEANGASLAVCAIEATGAFQESIVLTPPGQEGAGEDMEEQLCGFIQKHEPRAVAIGNGRGSREASKLVARVLEKINQPDVFSVIVNASGASVYATSKIGREELPDLDVTARVAVSAARRLQDPLKELVKTDPRNIGVGQYQHDVGHKLLREGLRKTVASCVNRVGVDLNKASFSTLRYVNGLKPETAEKIIARRTESGPFSSLKELLEIEGITPKIFEQCAGYLRIYDGEEPLDESAIHPESYPTVNKMAARVDSEPKDLVRNRELLDKIDLEECVDDSTGLYTLKDIRRELLRPGADPRPRFKPPAPLKGVDDIKDLSEGAEVEGIVTNVTAFGAFVDVGLEQDGLVHLSQLANRFVQDPRDVVHVGQIVKAKVIAVDIETPRISLSIKALQPLGKKRPRRKKKVSGPDNADSNRKDAVEKPRESQPAPSARPSSPRRSPERERAKKPTSGQPKVSRRPKEKKFVVEVDKTPLNTQLADQLAALRDRLLSS